jgi:phosphoserine phosphatase
MTDRLVAFDFDGTLSESEMTVLLGSEAGVAEQIDAITERAMNDEIGYAESLRERVALLEGLSESAADAAFGQVELRPGLGEVLGALSGAEGVRTAVLTGGFDRGVESALDRESVGVDRVVANRLVVAFAELTGEVEGPLIEGTKDDALEELCSGYGIQPRDVVAVGDGANDVPMLDAAGLAIGYEPKPAVEPHCDVVVGSVAELENVLDDEGLLG